MFFEIFIKLTQLKCDFQCSYNQCEQCVLLQTTFILWSKLLKGSNGMTINIFVLNIYHNLNNYTEKHFLKHKYLRMDKGQ